ncbi:MAG: cell division protein FtsQ/DivIB [Alphaproteobacteria bacterium]
MRPVSLRAQRRAVRRDRDRARRGPLRAGLLAAGLVAGWTALAAHPWWDAAARVAGDAIQRQLGLVLAELEIHGTARVDAATVRDALAIAPGTPILRADLDQARARVEALGWVADASVRRELPDRLVVALDEHEPRALWLGAGGPALVAAGGEMLPVPAGDAARGLPRLVGMGPPPALEPILRRLAEQPRLFDRLERLEQVAGHRWRLWLEPGVRVELPPGDVAPALARLARHQTEHALLDRAVAVVDLRVADRLVVTPAPLVREAAG